MANSIKEKTISGLAWSAIDNIASQGVTFLIGIILARLLTPKEFGTLGLALVCVGLFNQIVDCGFSNALIRNHKAKNIDYNTTFIFNIGVSLTLFILCQLIVPVIAGFFKDESLIKVLRWLSFLILLNALCLIQRTILIKRIDFKTQTKISIISSLAGGVVGIYAAYHGYGVMSLVYQQLSRQVIATIMFWLMNKWRPCFEFSIVSFKQQFSYGFKLLFSGLIDYIFNEAALIVIGKVYSPSTLGQYSRAKQFSSIFSSNLSAVMQRVTFPVLATLQDNKEELVSKYRMIVKSLMFVSGFCMITLACAAKPIVILTVGDKWMTAVKFLQIICFIDILYPIRQVNTNAIQVIGRSDLILKLTIIKRVLQIIPIALGVLNIYYLLYGLVILNAINTIINAKFASWCIPYTLGNQLRDIFKPLGVCIICGAVMFSVSLVISSLILQLIIQLTLGFTSLVLLSKLTKLSEFYFIRNLILEQVSKIKR